MSKLAEMRAKLLAAEAKKENNSGAKDNAMFPHWSIPDGTTATIRFLDDGNETNDFFWKERRLIKLPFSGIKGGDQSKAVTVTVPSLSTWGERCPIVEEIRPWWNDEAMRPVASKYNAKKSYMLQGFVVSSDLDETAPENPIRRFIVNAPIFKIIYTALMDPDFGDASPTDIEGGVDFKITKLAGGKWADYSTTTWARRPRSLTDVERDAITQHGLSDLNDFMPKKPSAAEVQAIVAMFEASIDGELYDPEKFSEFYRPWGMDKPNTSGSSSSNSDDDEEAAPVEKAAAEEVKAVDTKGNKPGVDEILAQIRARKEKN
jgi:hypothetical protein